MTGDAINLGLSIVEEIAGACVDDVTRVGIRAGFWGIRKAIGLVAGRGSPAVNLPEHPVERLLNELISDAKFQEARLVVLRLAAECGAPPDAVRGVMVQIDDAEQLGALFFLFEAATAYAGELYDIDAFDQRLFARR